MGDTISTSRWACSLVGLLLLWGSGSLTACRPSGSAPGAGGDGSLVALDLDKKDPERLLRYYFGAYAGPDGADPFDAGLVVERGGAYYLDREVLEETFEGGTAALQDADGSATIDWDELAAFIQATYYRARRLPETLKAFKEAAAYQEEPEAWLHVEVDGVMTNARRHLFVRKDALRSALRSYEEHDRQLLYPVGTAIVGEHRMDGATVETTVMQKRADGYWDFIVYGEEGRLVRATQTGPRPLKVPTQCVGCHFGSKLFEPEKSFPGKALPGPHGPRQVYTDDVLRDAAVVRYFDEHSRRSDTVLGLYNTLFVAQLQAARRAGTISPEDDALLAQLAL